MGLETYMRKGAGRRKPEAVQAMQMQRPHRKVQFAFPRSRIHNHPNGRFNYLRLIDAPEGKNRAKDGDWLIKFNDGSVQVVSQEEFSTSFTAGADAPEVGIQDQGSDTLDATAETRTGK